LLTAYHLVLEVGRYNSPERIIEDCNARYDETLELSSQGWHEGKQDCTTLHSSGNRLTYFVYTDIFVYTKSKEVIKGVR